MHDYFTDFRKNALGLNMVGRLSLDIMEVSQYKDIKNIGLSSEYLDDCM